MKTQKNWPEIIEKWKKSGLPKKEFCRQLNLSNASFYKYLSIYGDGNVEVREKDTSVQQVDAQESKFIELIHEGSVEVKARHLVKERYIVITTSKGCKIEVPL